VSRRWDICFVGDKVVRAATRIAILCLLATDGLPEIAATVLGQTATVTGTGNNNENNSVGLGNLSATVFGDGNKNTAIGKKNTAASILGSANKTHVFGRNSAATLTGLNNQTIKVKGSNKTSTAP
jgi:hypothetical protein